MKKLVSIALAFAAVLMLGSTALAADETRFDFQYAAEPSYEIVIPSQVNITSASTDVPIEVVNAKNFNGGTVSVKMAQTVPNGNFMSLSKLQEGGPQDGWWTATELKYDIVTADGTEIRYNRDNKWDTQYLNAELAAFSGDETKAYTMVLDINDKTESGSYAGLIQYLVEFVPAS
jgi:hypothetical protein